MMTSLQKSCVCNPSKDVLLASGIDCDFDSDTQANYNQTLQLFGIVATSNVFPLRPTNLLIQLHVFCKNRTREMISIKINISFKNFMNINH